MEFRNEEHKNRFKVSVRPIITLLIVLGFISAIISAAMIATSSKVDNQKYSTPDQQADEEKTTQASASEGSLFGVVQEIDEDNNQITLFDVERQEAVVLSYFAGTDITDKYDKAILISKISLGSMVDATYQQDRNKLIHMNISKKAWEYANVNNLNINLTDHFMKIASTKYKYTDDILVFDGKDFIMLDELADQDVLTVWGYEETIWSVTVTKGHGTVELKDYKAYLGDYITIGYEAMQQISEDMEITVREGEYNLTVENGEYSATKPITIKRNEVTYVSLKDIGPVGLKSSQVTFEITPYGADLSIDGKLTTYSDPVDLTYGEHSIAVSLGGYTSYKGTINIDSEGKAIRIALPEAASDEEAVVTETDANSGAVDAQAATSTDSSSSGSSATGTTKATTGNAAGKDLKINIQSPKGASVYLDGNFMGTSACSFKKVNGSHVLTFMKDGYNTMSYTIEVEDDGKDADFNFAELTEK